VNLQGGDLGAFALEIARGEEAEGSRVALSVPSRPVSVPFDRMLLRRATTNLLKNAREAMREAGVEAPPEIAVRVEEDRALLEIADRGLGVPAGSKARIFDPYFTTKREGTGLGLAIVKKIVLDHGGSIDVEDRPGGGAVFRIALPLAAEKERRPA
jgi:signal transduction histidine kinase